MEVWHGMSRTRETKSICITGRMNAPMVEIVSRRGDISEGRIHRAAAVVYLLYGATLVSMRELIHQRWRRSINATVSVIACA